jgi:hypothetical protein
MAVITTVTNSLAVELTEISCTGAQLRGQFLPREKAELLISIGGLKAFGTVAWSRGDECGISFDFAISEEDLRDVQQARPW